MSMELATAEPGQVVALMERATTMLAEANTIEEARDLRDFAALAQTWTRQRELGKAAETQAVELRIRAERRIGQVLEEGRERGEIATREHNPGAVGHVSGRDMPRTLPELGITRNEAADFVKLATPPEEEFDDHLEDAKAAGELSRAGVMRRVMDVHYSSSTDLWSTPDDLYQTLNAEFSFTVDVCATAENAKTRRYFDREMDGLKQHWNGSCWMNPPYGDEIPAWIEKAHESAIDGTTVVCLVPARVDTGWWWNHCRYGEIRFLRGRLKFGGATTSAPFPSAVVVFGVDPCVKWWEWR